MKKILSLSGFLALLLSLPAQAALFQNYGQIKTRLQELETKYPETTKQFDLGASDSGDTIKGLVIGNGPVKNLVVATHHGNEYGSTELAVALAEDLAKDPMPNQTIFVIPVLNIAGYNARNRNEPYNNNKSSQDANRDYPGPCGTSGPFKLKSTKALAEFVDKQNINASATLHSFYPAVLYPWGISTHDLTTPYQTIFEQLTKDATLESRYESGNSTEVLYPADGTFEDYAFWKHGIWSILFELGFSHSPNDSGVQDIIRTNIPGIRRMLANAPTTRAENHAFTGHCDMTLKSLDRHDE
jgi:carboxypeptidase T